MSETLVKVEGVSKKFCRDLKRSLWYGMKDLGNELLGKSKSKDCNLRKEEFWAVKNVNFELKRGECLGLIGRNGAGKTTLLKMLNGLIKPDKGRIEICGRVGALIALGAGFNPILSGRENIYVNAAVLGLSKKVVNEKFDEIVEFSELGEFIDMPVQSYSSGMQVRLGFAIAATLDPDVLILDEVLAVGDMGFRAKCYNVVGKLMRKTAVIFVSHSMPMISRVCTRAILLDKGVELLRGYPEAVIEAYFDQFPMAADPTANLTPNNVIRVLSVTVKKEKDAAPNNPIEYGEGLRVEIILDSSEELRNLIGRLSFLTTDLSPVAISDTKVAGFPLDLAKGLNTVSVVIPKLLLGPSKYMIGLTLSKPDSFDSILWVPTISSLNVVGTFVPNAPYYVEASWESLPANTR